MFAKFKHTVDKLLIYEKNTKTTYKEVLLKFQKLTTAPYANKLGQMCKIHYKDNFKNNAFLNLKINF
jgi:hypothetical protein